ncbi:MAG: phosphoribosylaminoimidazolesuccinocarboxamide synthase [Firmicutes bacterium]|nr:phosphoribosylaminoimidazolesuccinocarboxamide synthase [Bacillota bacterium]
MERLELLYEGKAKKVYRTNDPNLYWIEYKDDATAFNGLKKGTITNKGFYNNQISAKLFQLLENKGIPTHFVELVNEREMVVKALKIIPVEVIARNITAGSLAKRLGMEEGIVLNKPVLEFYYKSDELGDPMINEYHIDAINLATPEQMAVIKDLAWQINDILKVYFAEKGILLVDFKLEFGVYQGQVILGDEISPDTCRFWDAETKEKLDKDRFRRDLGNVEGAYAEVWRRLQS